MEHEKEKGHYTLFFRLVVKTIGLATDTG